MVTIGDQLILEEEFDETYVPNERGNRRLSSGSCRKGCKCASHSQVYRENGNWESVGGEGRINGIAQSAELKNQLVGCRDKGHFAACVPALPAWWDVIADTGPCWPL